MRNEVVTGVHGDRASNLGLENLSLDWDGVDQCRNWGLGALKFHVDVLRNMACEVEKDESRRFHFLVWMMEDQIEKIDSFMRRLCDAMMQNNIGIDDMQGRIEK